MHSVEVSLFRDERVQRELSVMENYQLQGKYHDRYSMVEKAQSKAKMLKNFMMEKGVLHLQEEYEYWN